MLSYCSRRAWRAATLMTMNNGTPINNALMPRSNRKYSKAALNDISCPGGVAAGSPLGTPPAGSTPVPSSVPSAPSE
eukprot:CAMPEP_0119109180 /NCGR_PEP_ID=MMETSP1180-20130426/17540_1 /TAXON_ID=3052 ORGANISM="Chlamydomonas cf sp, Strain CCMP681" /NCGR_SAMPLE_ID=MMETSP1180 /ASSEMBLY_ACC=CAM_ASM_000741 /LENGTH=76 /DNA_ID=CAMNT_0007094903 /DNA_START=748 /DNA_END=978 /DNA_ORIENTATION=+